MLSKREIDFVIDGVTNNYIQDYQTASLLMAICLNGLNSKETYYLTNAMLSSGEQLKFNNFDKILCDKHSTGGVADTVTLILCPMLAATKGIAIAKMSGRGLGHTGGTVDKLESIKDFDVNLSPDQFEKNVKEHSIAVIAQTDNMCIADKKLYALRDVTGTVDSIPLIASSIMCKKLASGASVILLDVKYGKGAFMKSFKEAQELAKAMVAIGKSHKVKTVAVVTDMNVPLGDYIGNKLEVYEAIQVLQGKKNRLYHHCLEFYALEVEQALNIPYKTAYTMGEDLLNSGGAYNKFLEFVKAQNGDVDCLNKEYLVNTKYQQEIIANDSGYVSNLDTLGFAKIFVDIGGGRKKKGDVIDDAVGFELNVSLGDKVVKGDKLFTVYYNDERLLDKNKLNGLIKLSSVKNNIKSRTKVIK